VVKESLGNSRQTLIPKIFCMMGSLKHSFKKSITQTSKNTHKFKIALAPNPISMDSPALSALLGILCSVCSLNSALLALLTPFMMKSTKTARVENRLSHPLQTWAKCIVQSFDDCRFS
jgi:hypothetical protein